ncbi:MAG: recombination protein RecR [Aquificae bacterium]|nr:recombination protein RecR [Aquificota bacterium]
MGFEDVFPKALRSALESVMKVPTFGEKGANRFVYNLLKLEPEERKKVVESLLDAVNVLRPCSECYLITDREICAICSDEKRSKKFICVVEESQDAYAIERLERYRGVYHVLGGRIAPLEGISPEDLTIDKLLERVERYKAREVILATNPNVEGEATANYIAKLLKRRFPNLKVTRTAYGFQFGSLIEFVDEFSLEKSLENRK